jgi:hypothetical protein
MKQTAVEKLELSLLGIISFDSEELRVKYKDIIAKAKEMEKQQKGYSEKEVLELIQFLAEKEDFKEHSSMSIFIAKDYLNQFKNK